jgi:hypothetical protein
LPDALSEIFFFGVAGQVFGDLPVGLFCRTRDVHIALARAAKQPAARGSREGEHAIAAEGGGSTRR